MVWCSSAVVRCVGVFGGAVNADREKAQELLSCIGTFVEWLPCRFYGDLNTTPPIYIHYIKPTTHSTACKRVVHRNICYARNVKNRLVHNHILYDIVFLFLYMMGYPQVNIEMYGIVFYMYTELQLWKRHTEFLVEYFVERYFGKDVEWSFIAGDFAGVVEVAGYFFSLEDIVHFIENKYTRKQMFEYYDYALKFAMKHPDTRKYFPLNIKNYKQVAKSRL